MKNFNTLFSLMLLSFTSLQPLLAQTAFTAQTTSNRSITSSFVQIANTTLGNTPYLSKDNPACIGNVNPDHSFTMTTQSSLGISNGQALTFGFTYKCADFHSGQSIPTEAIAFDVYWGASQIGPWYLLESFLNDKLQLGQKHLCPVFQPKAGVPVFIKVVATVNTLNNSMVDSWVVLDDLLLAPNQGEDVPIEPFVVSAKGKSHKIRLEWTSNAKHYAYFSIERATDHSNFKPIGKVCIGKRSNGLSTYTFEDQSSSPGKHYYYRVKYFDFYEHYQYSRVIEAKASKRNRAMHNF